MAEVTKLYRLPDKGVIAGVCAGLSEYSRIDVTIIRVIFFISIFPTGGVSILVYFLMALLMPVRDQGEVLGDTMDKAQEGLQRVAADVKSTLGKSRMRNYLGAVLMLIGLYLLLVELGPDWMRIEWDLVWSIVLIIVGVFILLGRKN